MTRAWSVIIASIAAHVYCLAHADPSWWPFAIYVAAVPVAIWEETRPAWHPVIPVARRVS